MNLPGLPSSGGGGGGGVSIANWRSNKPRPEAPRFDQDPSAAEPANSAGAPRSQGLGLELFEELDKGSTATSLGASSSPFASWSPFGESSHGEGRAQDDHPGATAGAEGQGDVLGGLFLGQEPSPSASDPRQVLGTSESPMESAMGGIGAGGAGGGRYEASSFSHDLFGPGSAWDATNRGNEQPMLSHYYSSAAAAGDDVGLPGQGGGGLADDSGLWGDDRGPTSSSGTRSPESSSMALADPGRGRMILDPHRGGEDVGDPPDEGSAGAGGATARPPWTEEELEDESHREHDQLITQVDELFRQLNVYERQCRNEGIMLRSLINEEETLRQQLAETERKMAAATDESKRLAADCETQSTLLQNLRRDSSLNHSMVHHLQQERAKALAQSKQELEQITTKITQTQEELTEQQKRADAALERLQERKQKQPGFTKLTRITEESDRLAAEIARLKSQHALLELKQRVADGRSDCERMHAEEVINDVVQSCTEFTTVVKMCLQNIYCMSCARRELAEQEQQHASP